jgi:hypothetical protein
VKIDHIECGHPALTARWPTEAMPVATVRVIVDAAKTGTAARSELKVILSEPAGRELVVPVSWSLPKMDR